MEKRKKGNKEKLKGGKNKENGLKKGKIGKTTQKDQEKCEIEEKWKNMWKFLKALGRKRKWKRRIRKKSRGKQTLLSSTLFLSV